MQTKKAGRAAVAAVVAVEKADTPNGRQRKKSTARIHAYFRAGSLFYKILMRVWLRAVRSLRNANPRMPCDGICSLTAWS
jgi:hypothetical protein